MRKVASCMIPERRGFAVISHLVLKQVVKWIWTRLNGL